MRKIRRGALSQRAETMLAKRRQRVDQSGDPKATVAATWNNKKSRAWDDIRAELRRMATGSTRCMYCEDSYGTHIEHFYPKATYPERAYEWTNYLLACESCNSNHKRDQFPIEKNRPLLIDPTRTEPAEYLDFSPSTGKWVPRRGCREGRESVRVFGLGRFDDDRRDAWMVFQELIIAYARHRTAGKADTAKKLLAAICKQPFSGVFVALLRARDEASRARHVEEPVLAALREYPELHELFD